MTEGLTKEAIGRICDLAQNGKKFEAIRAFRSAWPLGLKEAKNFLDRYGDDITSLRNQLLQMADLKEGVIFENYFLRVEVKNTDAPFPETHDFLLDALLRICPNTNFQERLTAFLGVAPTFFAGASFEEMNELCARLMKIVK